MSQLSFVEKHLKQVVVQPRFDWGDVFTELGHFRSNQPRLGDGRFTIMRGEKFASNQPRDNFGRWTSGGSGAGGEGNVISFAGKNREQRREILNELKPDDNLQLFHGTRDESTAKKIVAEGFDPSSTPGSRVYQGTLTPEKGFFVSPDKEVSTSFGSYVIEFASPAKSLIAPPEKGVEIGKQDEFWKSSYPNSFRPSLSASLSMGESQGLLTGKTSPKSVKAVWRYDRDKGDWTPTSPAEFLSE